MSSAYQEYVAELEFIVNEYVQEQTGKTLIAPVEQLHQEWIEMCSDPTWETDTTSAPPSFRDWLMDATEVL